jgi:hypothetical protein
MFGLAIYAMGSLGLATPPPASAGVTSIGLTMPSIYTVGGSPVTTSGTITVTLTSQSANTVFAGPDGAAGVPTFRALVPADIPGLDAAKITSGIFGTARLGSGAASAGTWLRGDGTWATIPSGFADPMTTAGDIIIRNASNVTTRLGAGTSGHVLTLVTGVPAWQPTTVTPAGSTTQIQFNNAGALGASAGLTWDDTAKTLALTGTGGTGSTLAVTIPVSAVTGVSITSNATANYAMRITDAGLPVNALASFEGVASTYTVQAAMCASTALTGQYAAAAGYFYADAVSGIPLVATVDNANATSNVDAIVVWGRRRGTVGATGTGARIGWYAETDSNNNRYQGSIEYSWTNATDGTRASQVEINVVTSPGTENTPLVISPGVLTVTGKISVTQSLSDVAGAFLKTGTHVGYALTVTNSSSGSGGGVLSVTHTNASGGSAIVASNANASNPTINASNSANGFNGNGLLLLSAAATTNFLASTDYTMVHMNNGNGTGNARNDAAIGIAFSQSSTTASTHETAYIGTAWYDSTGATRSGYVKISATLNGTRTGVMIIRGDGEVRILGSSAGIYVGHKAAATGATTYTWPSAYPASATGYFLTSNTSGTLTWSTISAMTDPMTTNGDMIYRAAGVPTRLAIGSAGSFLISNGSAPTWTRSVTENITTNILSLRNTSGFNYGVLSVGNTADASAAINAASAGSGGVVNISGATDGNYVLYAEVNAGTWTGIHDMMRLQRQGTAGAGGNGVGIEVYMPDDGPTNRSAGRMAIIWSSAATASYTSAFVVQLARSAVAPATVLTVDGSGSVTCTNTTAVTAAAVTVATTTLASTGTAAASFAARHLYQLHDAGGTLSDAVALDAKWTTATAAAEEAAYEVRLSKAGTLTLSLTAAPTYLNIHDSSGQLRINGTKVMGPRITGWGAPTGTATRSTFDTTTVTLQALAERVKALIDDGFAHGSIGL